ncbi:bifunctional diaminohydroxyphosphoribosylaminopyrimidine deaminase/5-amino-6-(5-phosphoribosylamino)uracil reductase RibD [candidate division WOR-3 bacterium]|nr:bifunctional diaminohydroxyphosphoribosylaminopyrimidine deaminase/5-amino-6-(5-phosphoribosylamino)uracil reductase RibD [candidate division WOR-3 bacterium]
MQYAFSLATRGAGQTGANPLVGAVVIKNGRIVGQGFHRKIGEAHAEVVALSEAGNRGRGADLHVNLEPCCTHGHTRPCVDAVLAAGIKRVCIAETDPNPAVNGRSVEMLRRHNIEVTFVNPPEYVATLNRHYRKYITTMTPYVILKIALTSNMKISGYAGKYVTREPALRYVHALRGRTGAVLVGINTVLADDPYLTDRLAARRNPARIIIDPRLRISAEANVLAANARRIIFTGPGSDREKIARLQTLGVEVVQMEARHFPTADLLRRIGMLKIGAVIVEGGGKTFTQFLEERTYDEMYVFVAPITVSTGIDVPAASAMIERARPESIGEDILYHVYRDN